jgi:nucleotide-binding universal stress UspA family protein
MEREVVEAAGQADLLVLARDGDRERPGPKSLGPPPRFVVDHAPCGVLLVWP